MPKKKVAKKKIKKASKKRVAKKEGDVNASEVFLYDVPEHKRFWCSNGSVYKNLEELTSGFKTMHPGTYSWHANEAKNDFAAWVYDCIGDITLANKLVHVFEQQKAARMVRARITQIKKACSKT